MLSIANVKNAAQAESYFSKEDYYLTKERDTAAQWWGSGAKKLGLEGRIDKQVFGKLLRGELPDGTVLPAKKGGERRAATDLTFSAPKTVSIEALVHGKSDVLETHEAAVKQALKYLEERAANVRVCRGGQTHRQSSDNLVVAMFEHHSSRSLDPQLHTHCLAINATQAPDGQWRALVNDDFYEHKMAAGLVYRAELARGLKQLGYESRQTDADGLFEIAKYSDDQIKSFSKRRQQIVKALDGELGDKLRDMGLGGAEAAKKANLGTREKKREVDSAVLHKLWQTEAKHLEAGPATRTKPGRDVEGDCPQGRQQAADEAVLWAIDHLSERRAVWNERDLLRSALGRRLADVAPDDIEASLARMRDAGELVVVGARREGQVLYSTREMLECEARAVELMQHGRDRLGAICSSEVLDQSLEAYGLTSGQARSAQTILTNEDMVVGVQGYAGTGKTTMLRAVRELAEDAGYTVRGMGVSGTAAKELQEGAGVTSSTVASHLLKRREAGSAKRELWLVDEASFLCSRDAVRLLESARSAGARMVLLGDKDQLPAIEAGQPFAQLCMRGMRTAVMQEIVRTKDETLKRAVYRTIDNKKQSESRAIEAAKEIVQSLNKSIVTEASEDARHDAVAKAYLASDRENTIALTASHKQRLDISDRIRKGLTENGTLSKTSLDAKVLVNRDLTKAQLRCAVTYKKGDIVRIARPRGYKSLGLEAGSYATVEEPGGDSGVLLKTEQGRIVAWEPAKAHRVEVYRQQDRELRVSDKIRWNRADRNRGRCNGTYARVLGLRPQSREAIVGMADGRRQVLDLDKEKHWDHGYVVTTNAAQGATCGKVIAHINTKNATLVGHEAWYVAISRAVKQAIIFTDDDQKLPEAITKDMRQPSAITELEEHERSLLDLERQAKETRVVPPWQRDAIEAFRSGRAADGLRAFGEHGWVQGHRAEWQAVDAVYDGWQQRWEQGAASQAAMLAATKRDVAALNSMARGEMRAAGQLGESQIVNTKSGERELAAGDLVRFCRAMPELSVVRGQVATVTEIATGGDGKGETRLRLDAGGRELNIRISDFDDIDYAYAATYRRGASIGADRVFVLASPGMDKQTSHAAVGMDAERVEVHWSRANFASEQGLAAAMSREPKEALPLEHLGHRALVKERGRREAAAMRAQAEAAKTDDAQTKKEKIAECTRAQAELERVRLQHDKSRQREPWMQQATCDVATGKVKEGLDAYGQRGNICAHSRELFARSQVYENWTEAVALKPIERSVMLAYRHKDAAELNKWARQTMREFGEYVGEDIPVRTAHGERQMAVGERVVFGRSNAELGIKSGSFGTVKAIDADKLSVHVAGREVQIDLKRYGHIDYAYAMTPWQASRVVADNVYLFATEHLEREALRTALSRHSKLLEVHWSKQTFETEAAMKEALARHKGEPARTEQLGIEALRRRLYRCQAIARQPDTAETAKMPQRQKEEIAAAREQLPTLRKLVGEKQREIERRHSAARAQVTDKNNAIKLERD